MQPPTTDTLQLHEAQSSEPVQRAHDRIQSLIDRGKDPHAGTIRRLESTSKPEKVHGIIQAAQHLADRAKGPDKAKWLAVADAGKKRHRELTGAKYKDEHYDTPEKVKPAVTPEAPPARKKLPTAVSAPKKKDKKLPKKVSSGQSKWVRVLRKRDNKIIQVRRGKHLNKDKYAPLKKAAEVQTAVPERIKYQGQVYVLKSAAWEDLPKGWDEKSLRSFWRSLTGSAKHKATKCIKRMQDKVDDPGAFCASLKRRMRGD